MEETNVHGVSTPQDEESMQGDKLATVRSIDTKAGDKIILGNKNHNGRCHHTVGGEQGE